MKKLIITFVLLVTSILCARAEYIHGFVLTCGETVYISFSTEPTNAQLLQKYRELEMEVCGVDPEGEEIQIPDKDNDIINP